jgi:hypothetical protein
METYMILRRSGWSTRAEFDAAVVRSRSVCDEQIPENVRWLRSYILEEHWGRIGSVCFYEGPSPEALRRHARLADLPIDEIVAVSDAVIDRPDSERATVREEMS